MGENKSRVAVLENRDGLRKHMKSQAKLPRLELSPYSVTALPIAW
jgi:hypothetical protein